MNPANVLDFGVLFFAGLLAGALFIIDYGVRGPITVLAEGPHIQVRQALIEKLRVVVPAIFLPAILLGAATTVLDGFGPGFAFRGAGLLVVVTSFALTLRGTAPINHAIRSWEPSAPPANWQALVSRWERLDRARTLAAITAFALFLTAMAFQLSAH